MCFNKPLSDADKEYFRTKYENEWLFDLNPDDRLEFLSNNDLLLDFWLVNNESISDIPENVFDLLKDEQKITLAENWALDEGVNKIKKCSKFRAKYAEDLICDGY